jgi:hypothetical protein
MRIADVDFREKPAAAPHASLAGPGAHALKPARPRRTAQTQRNAPAGGLGRGATPKAHPRGSAESRSALKGRRVPALPPRAGEPSFNEPIANGAVRTRERICL